MSNDPIKGRTVGKPDRRAARRRRDDERKRVLLEQDKARERTAFEREVAGWSAVNLIHAFVTRHELGLSVWNLIVIEAEINARMPPRSK